jgi:hypothetical protein
VTFTPLFPPDINGLSGRTREGTPGALHASLGIGGRGGALTVRPYGHPTSPTPSTCANKKSIEESNPPILTDSKVVTMFYRVPEILQCHSQFKIALTEAVTNWDEISLMFSSERY